MMLIYSFELTIIELVAKYRDLSVASSSFICFSFRLRQIIDLGTVNIVSQMMKEKTSALNE